MSSPDSLRMTHYKNVKAIMDLKECVLEWELERFCMSKIMQSIENGRQVFDGNWCVTQVATEFDSILNRSTFTCV